MIKKNYFYFSKIFAVFSGKYRYAWDQFYNFGAGKYRGNSNIVVTCSNYMLASLENEPYISQNNIIILILGKITKHYINIIENIIINKGVSELINFFTNNPPDCSLVVFNGNNNLPICVGYSNIRAHPLYICSKNEKNHNIVGLSSEVKCLSSKFDNSKKNDELINRIPDNNIFQIELNENIGKICYHFYPTINNGYELKEYRKFNNNIFSNLVLIFQENDIFINKLGLSTSIELDNLRELIYYMETNSLIESVLAILINKYIEQENNNLSEFLCIVTNDEQNYLNVVSRLFKYYSRKNIFIESINSNSAITLEENEWMSVKYYIKNKFNQFNQLESKCNSIYNELFGQINQNIRFDSKIT